MEHTFAGRAWKYGDNINTDVIFPGKYTYTDRGPDELAAHALEDLDPTFASGARPGDVIVAGRNWGCGSSREQAVTALKFAGVRAVVAVSFARIYFRNAVNQGLLPIVCPEAVTAIESGDEIEVDLARSEIRSNGRTFRFAPMSGSILTILEAGGLIPMLRQRLQNEATS